MHFGGGHGNVEQVVGDHGGQAQQQQQLPPFSLNCSVQDVPLLPLCSEHGCHNIPQQVPAGSKLVHTVLRHAVKHRAVMPPIWGWGGGGGVVGGGGKRGDALSQLHWCK